MYVNAMLTENLYVIGGNADRNANSSDEFGGFDTFFNDKEYFSTLKFGCFAASADASDYLKGTRYLWAVLRIVPI